MVTKTYLPPYFGRAIGAFGTAFSVTLGLEIAHEAHMRHAVANLSAQGVSAVKEWAPAPTYVRHGYDQEFLPIVGLTRSVSMVTGTAVYPGTGRLIATGFAPTVTIAARLRVSSVSKV